MNNTYVIPGTKLRGSATVIIQLTGTQYIGFFIPKWNDLLKANQKAIASELKSETIKNIIKKLPKNATKLKCKLLSNISPTKQYKSGVIKLQLTLTSKKDLTITLVRSDKIPNWKTNSPKTSWLIVKRTKSLQESANNKQPTCLFIKGNPKYWIKGVSEKMYNQIQTLCKKAGYKFLTSESDVHSSKLPNADVVIAFSRGNKYLKLPIHKWKYKIGIGENPNTMNDIYVVNNPGDKTMYGDLSKDSLLHHWTLTNNQIHKIEFLLNKFKNRIMHDDKSNS